MGVMEEFEPHASAGHYVVVGVEFVPGAAMRVTASSRCQDVHPLTPHLAELATSPNFWV